MTASKLVGGVEYKLVFTRYKRVNGRIVYPKNAKVFRFWVKA